MSFSAWKEVELGDVCSKIGSGSTPTGGANVYSESGISLIRSQNILDFKFSDIGLAYINEIQAKKLNIVTIEEGDVLLNITGDSVARSCIVPKDILPARVNQHVAIIRGLQNSVYNRYILYYLQNNKTYLLSIAGTGGTRNALTKKMIENLNIKLPPFHEQKAIADTLSCLDDKIELNNRINKTLEEMAQAIFKSWFVDFEPFQEGEFENSELGRIPKGWRVGTISDLGDIIGGSTPSKTRDEYYTDKGIAWITPKDLSNNKDKFISKGEIDITDLGLKNSSTKIMPKGTVLFSSRAPIGYMAIAKNNFTTNQGFKSIVPKSNIGTAYIYCFLKSNIDVIENRASGSTFMEVSGSVMKQIPALIPSDSVLERFQNICSLYFNQQMLLENQNQTLTTIRDSLLPKLMSGEIRVPIDEVQ